MNAKSVTAGAICLLVSILTGCTKKANPKSDHSVPTVVTRNFISEGTASDSFTAFFQSYTAVRTAVSSYTVSYPDDTTFIVAGLRYYMEMGNYLDSSTATMRSVSFYYSSKSSVDSNYVYNEKDIQPSYIRIKNDTLYIHFHSGGGCSEYNEVSDFVGKISKL